ncbi:MAG: hypothetical protein ACRCWU_00015 [Metamycoplasmataceae bacterium]
MINNFKKMLLGIMVGSATIVPLVFIASYNVILVNHEQDSNSDILKLASKWEQNNLITKDSVELNNEQNSLLKNELNIIINYELEPLENENVELLRSKLIKHHSKMF